MSDNVKNFLEAWYKAVEGQDHKILEQILAEDISFHSPAFWTPKQGREVTILVLKTVESIFENFTYTKEWVSGNEIILEFSANVSGKSIKGIDRITLNDEGLAIEFEVMVRPLNGLMALAQTMGEKLGLATS